MILAFALLALQANTAKDLTLQPGAVLNGTNLTGRSTNASDNFNRANGPMNGSWTQQVGCQNLDSNQGVGLAGQGNAWMKSTSANCPAASSRVTIDFEPNPSGTLKYLAAVSGLGVGGGYYVKIQSQSSTLYNFLGFYVGFNGGAGSYGQFAAITPVVSGRMYVWYNCTTDRMMLEIDEFNNGSLDYTYSSAGPASSVGSLTGTGHGIGTYGEQRYDNWLVDLWGGSCCLTLSKTGTCPGAMSFSVAGATPGLANVALIYGNAGAWVKPNAPCKGLVTVHAGVPTLLLPLLNVNSSGVATRSIIAPAGVCGKSMQAVDLKTCCISNPVII